ncbi:MAG: sugar ABC transporter ATP-binding protein [Gemmatales bacterium]|nr:MAG: sugar ABC transporter ATP-binding protein [Gemmatales bacterium]
MTGISKRFGSTQALAGVDLELARGEVHALVGENGAGKSTLMKILSGAERPDAGTMLLDGSPYAPKGPPDARRRGVAMVYQELTLARHLSVEANVVLGLEETRFGFLRRGHDRQRVEAALRELEHPEILPDAPVSALSAGAQQLVEIARALLVDARILILDEPTSSLTQEDAGRLFRLIRRLRDRGVTIVYISHFLEEVEQIADRCTVLRDGKNVGTAVCAEVSREQIIEWMVGRSLTEQFPKVPHAIGEPILEIRELSGKELPRGVNLTLHRGEILGLAGIVGAGRTELLRAIYALDPVKSGEIVVRSNLSFTRPTPAGRIAQGVGFLSENRKEEGLALPQSIADNLTYSRLKPYQLFGWLQVGKRRQAVRDWLGRLNVRYAELDQPVGELSGGNQQKIALGRLLHQQADVLLLDEPTRGVDIGSKSEIYRLIGELARQGKAILFVSSYLPELLGVCDRLAVMVRGRLSRVKPVTEWTPQEVMLFATEAEANQRAS